MKTIKLLQPKKDYISFIATGSMNANYLPSGVYFAFCSEPNKNNTIRLRSHFVSCRDQLCCQPEAKFRNKQYTKLPIRKTRLIVMSQNKGRASENVIEKTVRFLNMLEKHYKWTPTVVRKVDISGCDNIRPNAKKVMAAYAFFSGPRWIRSSHMLSIYSLIIRACVFHNEVRSIKTFKEFSNNKFRDISGKDATTIRAVFSHLPKIMGNYNKLFQDLPMKANYTTRLGRTTGKIDISYGEGILRLISGEARHKELQKRFDALK